MMLNETYTLSNGVKIPKLGLGTWFIDDDKAGDTVKEAVKLGYRLIDTAQAYGNERGVGEGVRNCGLPRNEIFVTSKVAAETKSYESAAASIDETLSKMGLDYIDMMIIHSPQPWAEFRVEKRYFEENKEVYVNLASTSEIIVQADKNGISEDAVSVVIPGAVLYLPLEDLVDFEKEKERLHKEKDKLTKELARSKGMLSNEKFLNNAKPEKVQEEKDKLAKYEQMMAQVEARLAQMK